MNKSLVSALSLVLLAMPFGGHAATIGADIFDVNLTANGSEMLFAGYAAPDGIPPDDVVDSGQNIDAFQVKWVDGDTFFFSATAQEITDLTVAIFGLDFTEGPLAAFIRNVVFDPTQGGFTGFVGHTRIAAPAITFDTRNIVIKLPEIPSNALAEQFFVDAGEAFEGQLVNLAADGISFYFNVTATPNVASVPLPAGGWLLAGAVGLLAAQRRRKSASSRRENDV